MNQQEYGLFCMDMAPDVPEMTESTFPPHVSLGMMYVPFQRFENLYDGDKALERGTLFADLDLPFYGRKAGNGR